MMKLLNTTSLAATLDAVNEAFFLARPVPKAEGAAAAAWIAAQQGGRGSYRCMPAPTPDDFRSHPRLFTGERLISGAGTSHILGQEACRALILLDAHTQAIDGALARSQAWLREPQDRHSPRYGTYCCGICSVALWRHLTVSDLPGADHRVAAGLKILKQRRDGEARWKIFPYYYTLLTLLEMNSAAAREEMRYTAPVCERLMCRKPTDDPYAHRRQAIAQRVLARC
jgi:hypothetical protein